MFVIPIVSIDGRPVADGAGHPEPRAARALPRDGRRQHENLERGGSSTISGPAPRAWAPRRLSPREIFSGPASSTSRPTCGCLRGPAQSWRMSCRAPLVAPALLSGGFRPALAAPLLDADRALVAEGLRSRLLQPRAARASRFLTSSRPPACLRAALRQPSRSRSGASRRLRTPALLMPLSCYPA